MAKSAQGMVIGISTLPATTYTPINCTTTVNMEDGESADIDVTCLSSDAKEYLVGLQDSGSLSLDLNVVFGDAGYVLMQTAKASGDLVGFQIELKKEGAETTGRTFTFEGFVKSLPFTGAVDSAITGTASVRISGSVTEADPITV